MFDLSAQALKRLELIGYIVLKLNYSVNCNNLYLKKTFQVFKTILIEKEVKFTYAFLQNVFLGHSWKLAVIVLCIYDRESTSMWCISLTGSLCASLFSENKFKLVITRSTACLTVACVLRIHDVSVSNGLSFKILLPYGTNPCNYSPQFVVIQPNDPFPFRYLSHG